MKHAVKAYNRGSVAEPQQGPGAESLVRESGRQSLLKLKALKHLYS